MHSKTDNRSTVRRSNTLRATAACFDTLEGRQMMAAVPATPTGLSVRSTSSTSVFMSWTDKATDESGYKVEQSSDGKNFLQVSYLGANAKTWNAGSLTKGKTYTFRVRAYNGTGNSAYSNASTVVAGGATVTTPTTPVVTTPTPPTVPTKPTTPVVTTPTTPVVVTPTTPSTGVGSSTSSSGNKSSKRSSSMDGLNVNGVNPAQVIPHLRALNMKVVRLWLTAIPDWNARPWRISIMDQLKAYKAAGIQTIVTVQIKQTASYDQAKAMYSYLVNLADAKKNIDYWEIGNEINLSEYYNTPSSNGGVAQYTKNVLKAAWDVLHAAGEKVIGTPMSFKTTDLQTAVNNGYLNYCDIAGFHHYAWDTKNFFSTFNEVKRIIGSKPLAITEWQLHLNGNTSASAQAAALDTIRSWTLANTVFTAYYRALYSTSAYSGTWSILYTNYTANRTFYDLFANWNK